MSSPTVPVSVIPPGVFAAPIVAPFIVSSALAGGLVLLWAFYMSSFLGLILGWILKVIFKSRGMLVNFDSINVAPLSGTMAIKGLVFANRDFSFRAVDGFFRIRWWLQHVKTSLDDGNSCRLELELNGVDVQVYNNVSRYEQLRTALLKRRLRKARLYGDITDATASLEEEVLELTELQPVEDWKMPFLARLSPVLKLVVHKGSLLVGNPHTHALFSLHFKSAHIKHTTEQPTHIGLDYFKTKIRVDLSQVSAKLLENSLHSFNQIRDTKPADQVPLKDETQAHTDAMKFVKFPAFFNWLKSYSFKALSQFELYSNATTTLANNVPLENQAQTREDENNLNAPFLLSSPIFQSQSAWKQMRKAQEALFEQAEPIMTIPSLRVEYAADSPGPVVDTEQYGSETKSTDELDESALLDLWPRQTLEVVAPSADISYGPHQNRLRSIIQTFFLPGMPPPHEAPRQRQYQYFDMSFKIEESVKLRIPFSTPSLSEQSPSSSPPSQPPSAPSSNSLNEWVELQTGPVTILYKLPSSNKLLNKLQIQVQPSEYGLDGFLHAMHKDEKGESGETRTTTSSSSSDSSGSTSETMMLSNSHGNVAMDVLGEHAKKHHNDPRVFMTTSLHPGDPWFHFSALDLDVTIETPPFAFELEDMEEEQALEAGAKRPHKKKKKGTAEANAKPTNESVGRWTIDAKVYDSCIFFLRDHADLLSRLGIDFSLPAQPNIAPPRILKDDQDSTTPSSDNVEAPSMWKDALAQFRPFLYDIHLQLVDRLAIHLNMNERNIVDKLSNMKENTYYSFMGPRLDASLQVSMIKFQQASLPVSFELMAPHLSVIANYCEKSTMRHLYETSNEDEESNFLFARSLALRGRLLRATGNSVLLPNLPDMPPEQLTDHLDLNFEVNQVKGKAVGSHLNLFDRFIDNYVGDNSKSRSSKQASATPGTNTQNAPTVQNQNAPLRKMDILISVKLKHPTVTLPLNLYNDQILAVVKCREVVVDVRAGTELSLAVAVSPATIYFPSCGCTVVKKPMATLGSLNVELLMRKAKILVPEISPLPIDVTYRQCIKVYIGDVTAAVEPVHMLRALDGVQGLFYTLFNRDNRPDYEAKSVVNPSDNLKHFTIFLALSSVNAKIWGPRGVIQASLPRGLKMAHDSLFGYRFGKYLRLRLPTAKLQMFAMNRDSNVVSEMPENEDWIETGAITIPKVIIRNVESPSNGTVEQMTEQDGTSTNKEKDGPTDATIENETFKRASMHMKQLEFLRKCDETRGRLLPYIWIDDEKLWSSDPSHRPWIRNFFDSPLDSEILSSSPFDQPSSLVERIFNKCEPHETSGATTKASPTHPSLGQPKSTSSQPLRPLSSSFKASTGWKSLSRPAGRESPLSRSENRPLTSRSVRTEPYTMTETASMVEETNSVVDKVAIEEEEENHLESLIASPNEALSGESSEETSKESLEEDESDSDFYSAHSSDDVSERGSVLTRSRRSTLQTSRGPNFDPLLKSSMRLKKGVTFSVSGEVKDSSSSIPSLRQSRSRTASTSSTNAQNKKQDAIQESTNSSNPNANPKRRLQHMSLAHLLDHHTYDIQGSSSFAGTDKLGDFRGDQAHKLELSKDSFGTPSSLTFDATHVSAPGNASSNTSSSNLNANSAAAASSSAHHPIIPSSTVSTSLLVPQKSKSHSKKVSSGSVSSTTQHSPKGRTSLRVHSRASSRTSPANPTTVVIEDDDAAHDHPQVEAYEAKDIGTLVVSLSELIDAHVSPPCLVMVSDALEHFVRERITINTLLDRMQLSLVSKLIVSEEPSPPSPQGQFVPSVLTGILTHQAVSLQLAGVRLNLLQSHTGDTLTNFITSVELGKVVFSMKTSTEDIRPSVYANNRYHLPSLIKDTRSIDMSVTLASSRIFVEKLSEAYSKSLVAENRSDRSPFASEDLPDGTGKRANKTFANRTDEGEISPEVGQTLSEPNASTSVPSESSSSTHPSSSAPVEANSKVIFSATLTDSLQFLSRFVAPSYLATREAATFVSVGKVVGAMKEEFGAYLASFARAWMPYVSTLTSSASGVAEKGRLAHLVLYELLVQLRDVEVHHDPYDAFGEGSEAQRTAWMLLYITRLRLLGCIPRMISEQSRLVAGQVTSATVVSVESVRSFFRNVAHLKPHHMPPLLAGCIDLDYHLHEILSKDPDILGSHFLVGDQLFLKRSETTRQRFNVHIQGLLLKLPTPPSTPVLSEDMVRSSVVLLPVDVTALTKVSVKLPPMPSNHPPNLNSNLPVDDTSDSNRNSAGPQSSASQLVHPHQEDLLLSSTDPFSFSSGSNHATAFSNQHIRLLAPITTSETQFLANSKGVKIHLTPKVLELGQSAMREWNRSTLEDEEEARDAKTSKKKFTGDEQPEQQRHPKGKSIFEPIENSSMTLTTLPVRFPLLEQMVKVSPDLFSSPPPSPSTTSPQSRTGASSSLTQTAINRDRHAISGHLVSDAFSVRATSRHGTLALDIPETTLTLSSLPVSPNGHRPASHTVMLRLPLLKFAAVVDRRRRMAPSHKEFSEAPIQLELVHFDTCIMFTPNGISMVEVGGKQHEFRGTPADPSERRRRRKSVNRSNTELKNSGKSAVPSPSTADIPSTNPSSNPTNSQNPPIAVVVESVDAHKEPKLKSGLLHNSQSQSQTAIPPLHSSSSQNARDAYGEQNEAMAAAEGFGANAQRFDALDIVMRLQSFTLPFKMPHPVYTMNFIHEWTPSPSFGEPQSTLNAPTQTAPTGPSLATTTASPRVPRLELETIASNAAQTTSVPIELEQMAKKSSKKSKKAPAKRLSSRPLKHPNADTIAHQDVNHANTGPTDSGDGEVKPVLPFLTRKVRATFHAHLENITFLMTQLADLPVKYQVPELAILSRHAEFEHALHISVKSHSISFEPKKSKVSVDSDNFDFASTKITSIELPRWTIESTLRQYPLDASGGDDKEQCKNTGEEEQFDFSNSRKRRKSNVNRKDANSKQSSTTLNDIEPTSKNIRTDIQSSISIHYVQNILKATVIKNLLVFQATISREIQSVLQVLADAKKQQLDQQQASQPNQPSKRSSAQSVDSRASEQVFSQKVPSLDADDASLDNLGDSARDKKEANQKSERKEGLSEVGDEESKEKEATVLTEQEVKDPFAFFNLWPNVRWRIDLDWKGLEIQVESPHATIILYSGHLRAAAASSKKLSSSSSTPGILSPHEQGDLPFVTHPTPKNPFDFRAHLTYLTALLCPPRTNVRLYNKSLDRTETGKVDVWAGISTNVTLQSFHDERFKVAYSSHTSFANAKPHASHAAPITGAFKSMWIMIEDTHVLVQPWVGEKALLMWLYFSEYHSSIVRRKDNPQDSDMASAMTARTTRTTSKSGFSTARDNASTDDEHGADGNSPSDSDNTPMMLEGTNATIFVQVSSVAVLVPGNSLKEVVASRLPLALSLDPRFNLNSVLIMRLDQFTFSGSTRSSNAPPMRASSAGSGASTSTSSSILYRPKRTQILANAVVTGFAAGFDVLDYEKTNLSLEDKTLYTAPNMNLASISEADCRFVFVKQSKVLLQRAVSSTNWSGSAVNLRSASAHLPAPASSAAGTSSTSQASSAGLYMNRGSFGPSSLVGSVELTTAGLNFKFNAQLYSHVAMLVKCVELGQSQLTTILEELNRLQQKETSALNAAMMPKTARTSRARGGTVSLKSGVPFNALASMGSSFVMPSSGSSTSLLSAATSQLHLTPTSAHHTASHLQNSQRKSTFQLDVTLFTTAGAIEFYSCVSANKADISSAAPSSLSSGSKSKPHDRGHADTAASLQQQTRHKRNPSNQLDLSDESATSNSFRIPLVANKNSSGYSNARASIASVSTSGPTATVPQNTLLLRVPLPQAKASFTNTYSSTTASRSEVAKQNAPSTAGEGVNDYISRSSQPSSATTTSSSKSSLNVDPKRVNSNVIAISIDSIDCIISPDLVIFYHELLTQVSVMKLVLKDGETNAEGESNVSGSGNANGSAMDSSTAFSPAPLSSKSTPSIVVLGSNSSETVQDPKLGSSENSNSGTSSASNTTSSATAQPNSAGNDKTKMVTVEDKEETWTVHFHLKPSSVVLNSTPYSETTCSFKTGDVIVMYQSSYILTQEKEASTTRFSTATSNSSSATSSPSQAITVNSLQRSLLVSIGFVALKMEYPHLEKDLDLASLEITSIRLHASHTQLKSSGLSLDLSNSGKTALESSSSSNPLTLLITVKSTSGFFSIRHLQETLLFFSVWQQGIYLSQYADFFGNASTTTSGVDSHSDLKTSSGSVGSVGGDGGMTSSAVASASATSPASAAVEEELTSSSSAAAMSSASQTTSATSTSSAMLAQPPPPSTGNIGVLGMLLEQSSILLNVELHATHLVSDLGPSLASVTLDLDYLICSASSPGRSKMDPLGEMFDVVLEAGPLDLLFHGTLEGSIAVPTLSLHARRLLSLDPTKSSSQQHPHATPALAGRTIFSGSLAPISALLHYSLSPVILLKTGDIVLAAYDGWRRKESDEDDEDEDSLDSMPSMPSKSGNEKKFGKKKQKAQKWEKVTNIIATLGPVELDVSNETISVPTTIAKRLVDSIRKSNDKAKETLKSMDQLLVVKRDLRKMKFKAGMGSKPLERVQHLKSLLNNTSSSNASSKPGALAQGGIHAGSFSHHHHHSKTLSHPSGQQSAPRVPTTSSNQYSNRSGAQMSGEGTKLHVASTGSQIHSAGSMVKRKKLPIGSVKFVGSSLKVRMFSFSLRDPNWFDVSLTSFQIALTQQVQKMRIDNPDLGDDDLDMDSSLGSASAENWDEEMPPANRSTLSGSSGSVIVKNSKSKRQGKVQTKKEKKMERSPIIIYTVSRELSVAVGGANLSHINEPRSSSSSSTSATPHHHRQQQHHRHSRRNLYQSGAVDVDEMDPQRSDPDDGSIASYASQSDRRRQELSTQRTAQQQNASQQQSESVFIIPATTLVQLSSQDAGSTEVEVYLMTKFDGPVRVSLKLNLYTDLKDTVASYQRAIDASKNVSFVPLRLTQTSGSISSPNSGNSNGHTSLKVSRKKSGFSSSTTVQKPTSSKITITPKQVHHSHAVEEASGSATTAENSVSNTKRSPRGSAATLANASQKQNDDTLAQESSTVGAVEIGHGEEAQRRIFVVKRFDFDPSVDVLGDFTPKINTVLGWLGIKDGEKTIPKTVHMVTDILEAMLAKTHVGSRRIAKERRRWKKFGQQKQQKVVQEEQQEEEEESRGPATNRSQTSAVPHATSTLSSSSISYVKKPSTGMR